MKIDINNLKKTNFGHALFIQKIAEFIFTVLIYASYQLLDSPFCVPDRNYCDPGIPPIQWIPLTSIIDVLGIYIFTLYPIILTIMIFLFRLMLRKNQKRLISFFSSTCSFFYILLWMLIMEFPLRWYFLLMMAIVTIFIYLSSMVLLPESSKR